MPYKRALRESQTERVLRKGATIVRDGMRILRPICVWLREYRSVTTTSPATTRSAIQIVRDVGSPRRRLPLRLAAIAGFA